MRMATNKILSLLTNAISMQFNNILHDINNKTLQEFSIFCMANSLILLCFFCMTLLMTLPTLLMTLTTLLIDMNNTVNGINDKEQYYPQSS